MGPMHIEREREVRTTDGRVPHGKHNSFITDGWVPRVERERERGVRMANGWISNSASYTWAK
jgi:hypothetical protein